MASLVTATAATKRIGIVARCSDLFKSGIVQNAVFLYLLYKKLGYACDMLAYKPTMTHLDYADIPICEISDDETVFDVSRYAVLITVTHGVSKRLYEAAKRHGVYVVGFICGNVFMISVQAFVSPTEDLSIIDKSSPVDELWTIRSFAFMKAYLELMRGAPTYCVPHLWSPCILEDHAVRNFKRSVAELVYDPKRHATKKFSILILEPNRQYVKTALVPILASERVHLSAGDALKDVYVFNYPQNPNSEFIVNTLSVKQKLRKFANMHIAQILLFFNAQDTIPIFVSHQLYTEWNYLYYELMYYGYPFVHNSSMMKDFGYYYPEMDVDACAHQIQTAASVHNRLCAEQMVASRAYLSTIDPHGETSCRIWDGLLRSLPVAIAPATASG